MRNGRVEIDEDRFWKLVHRLGPTDCWPWLGVRMRGGYGQVSIGGRNSVASRVALAIKLGRPIAPGMLACHDCDNPPCCNPDHLYEGTPAQNKRDSVRRGRHTWQTIEGARNGRAVLSPDSVRKIREAIASGTSQTRLAKEFGVHVTTISQIHRRLIWRSLD